MSIDTFYYGQGRVSLAPLDATTGLPGAFRYIGDVSALSAKMTTEQVKHIESNTGKRSLAASFDISQSLSIDMTLHSIDPDNIALAIRGAVNSTTSGTVTAESLGTALAAGDEVYLANPGVSDLVITDSTGTPLTLTLNTDYSVDLNFGRVTILNVGAYVQPFKAAYSYAARKSVGFFVTGQKNYAMRYEGVNLAAGNAPTRVDYYKLAPSVVQELQHITSGNDVAGMQITGDVLQDQTKSATGPLGQFGAITQIAASA